MGGDRPARERDRYARASWPEQVGDLLAELRGHPGVVALLVCLFGGWLVLTVTRPQVLHVADLRAGDCLYIHALDADTDSPTGRPAGTTSAQTAALYESGAERAACDASHSHEVIVALTWGESAGAAFPGTAALLKEHQSACSEAFTAWVGRPPEGSALEPVVAIPPEQAWTTGVRAGACLVASTDGQFLSGSTRGSGR